MGFHISWVGVRGKSPDVIRAELGLIETTERQEIPEADICGLSLSSGWYIVYFNSIGLPQVEMKIAGLSRNAELVTCAAEEGSMCSLARGYSNGRCTWIVMHEANRGRTHLQETGDLPPGYSAIRDAQLKMQSSTVTRVDYVFDVPILLAHHITGFRHDRLVDGMENRPFVVLKFS